MNPQEAYNIWAVQYDSNENKTRDLEAQALRNTLSSIPFQNCLEIGCGTGKNTQWLIQKAQKVTAVDLSEEMLARAKEKITGPQVQFIQADINNNWDFVEETFDLITFSLVLEHIENLEHIFKEAFKILEPGGHIYIGELHPFKQYSGSKARFETEGGTQVVQCYNHHISDFLKAAAKYSLVIAALYEYFDNDDKTTLPRILTLVLHKPANFNFEQ